MAIPYDTLYDEAACYICVGVSEVQALTLALLRRWLLSLNPAADTTPDALLQYGACFRCYTEGNIGDLMKISLLDQISDAS